MAIEWHTPFIPFDFKVLMPHHLAQGDEQGGGYVREGKSYKRLWTHAIHEGTKTRFWEGDGNTADQIGAENAFVRLYPGEEYAFLNNDDNPEEIEIGRPLCNELVSPLHYPSESQPWSAGDVAGEQDDARSLFWGVQALPANERKLAARGLTILFFVQFCAEKVRFLGWGGEFGAGSHNQYYIDPLHPWADATLPTP